MDTDRDKIFWTIVSILALAIFAYAIAYFVFLTPGSKPLYCSEYEGGSRLLKQYYDSNKYPRYDFSEMDRQARDILRQALNDSSVLVNKSTREMLGVPYFVNRSGTTYWCQYREPGA